MTPRASPGRVRSWSAADERVVPKVGAVIKKKSRGRRQKLGAGDWKKDATSKFYFLSGNKANLTKKSFVKWSSIRNSSMSKKAIGKLFREMDRDRNGTLEVGEFIEHYPRYMEAIEGRRVQGRPETYDSDGEEVDEKENLIGVRVFALRTFKYRSYRVDEGATGKIVRVGHGEKVTVYWFEAKKKAKNVLLGDLELQEDEDQTDLGDNARRALERSRSVPVQSSSREDARRTLHDVDPIIAAVDATLDEEFDSDEFSATLMQDSMRSAESGGLDEDDQTQLDAPGMPPRDDEDEGVEEY